MRAKGLRYQQNSLGLRLDLSLKFQKNLRGNKYKAIATSFFQDGFDMPCLMSFRGKKNTSLLSQVFLKMLQNPKVRTHHQQLIHNPIALSSLSLNTLFNKWMLSSIFTDDYCSRYNWNFLYISSQCLLHNGIRHHNGVGQGTHCRTTARDAWSRRGFIFPTKYEPVSRQSKTYAIVPLSQNGCNFLLSFHFAFFKLWLLPSCSHYCCCTTDLTYMFQAGGKK